MPTFVGREIMAMKRVHPDKLGKPDATLANLKIWVLGREFEDSDEFWDANWVNVVAHCSSPSADVWAEGPILHLGDLDHWLGELRQLLEEPRGTAELPELEPNLKARVTLDKTGRGTFEVDIAEDPLGEAHHFEFEIDRACLSSMVSALESVFQKYPLKGNRPST